MQTRPNPQSQKIGDRFRFLILGALIALTFPGEAGAQSQRPPQAGEQAANSQTNEAHAASPAPSPVASEQDDAPAESADSASPCDDPNSDLCQQARMAVAAEDLVALTMAEIVFLVLTLGGTIVLGVIGVRTTHRQLRAYVLADEFQITVRAGAENDVVVEVGCTLKNFGQTPAMHFTMTNAGTHGIDGDQRPPFEKMASPENRISKMVVGPGKSVQVPYYIVKLNREEFEELKTGKRRVYQWGIADYTDAFGRRHRTTFHHRSEAQLSGARWPLAPCKVGNEAD